MDKYKNVLVLGGTGFVGKNLQDIEPEWDYIGTCGGKIDYRVYDHVHALIEHYEPDAIVNLAATVGGIKFNDENKISQYEDNILINTNILMAARGLNVPRVLSALSTCVFPNAMESCYPLDEFDLFYVQNDFHKELVFTEPFEGHKGYAWSKRMLQIHTELCRQLGYNYSTFCPSNIYGVYDKIGEDSHFVSALINKVDNAKDGDTLKFWGTGLEKRQQLYVRDLAEMIPTLLEKHDSDRPVIIAPNENLTISEMVGIMVEISGKNLTVEFTGQRAGQVRKDCVNRGGAFQDLFGDYQYTSFRDGLKETYEWFV